MAEMNEAEKTIVKAVGETFDTFFGEDSTRPNPDANEEIGVDEATIINSARNKTGASEAEVRAVIDRMCKDGHFVRENGNLIFRDWAMWIG